jgi:hypothetical protein
MTVYRGRQPHHARTNAARGQRVPSSRRLADWLAFEHSVFAVDVRPDLSMVVYNPATAADAENVRAMIG